MFTSTKCSRLCAWLTTATALVVLAGACSGDDAKDAGPLNADGSPSTAKPTTTVEPNATTSSSSAQPTSSTAATTATTSAPTTPTTVAPTTTLPTTAPPSSATMRVKVYLFRDPNGSETQAGPVLVPATRWVSKTTGVAGAAIGALLDGPTSGESSSSPALRTDVPSSTALLGVDLDGNVLTVDLTSEYQSSGDTQSKIRRLAQVVYTATQFDGVDRVQFRFGGEDAAVLVDGGAVRSGPVSRSDYRGVLPDIFVDGPAAGDTLANPARIVGVAAVFEATFHVAILDGDGRTLAEPPFAMTSDGTGWGTFDVSLPYDTHDDLEGTVMVWANSAEDGRRIDILEVPVHLTAG